jgi:hypothetical protein
MTSHLKVRFQRGFYLMLILIGIILLIVGAKVYFLGGIKEKYDE